MNSRNSNVALHKPVFTVSIDFELMWGTADRPYSSAFRGLCEIERREVVGRLLGLLAEYEVSATWGVVGHLFLHQHESAATSPAGYEPTKSPASLYYGADLVDRIQRCAMPQDIGSHTFCHIEMDDSACSKATAELEVAECVRLAKSRGIEMKSFIFPRNRVGHLDVLQRYGFTSYRGPEQQWYKNRSRNVRRFGHLLEIATAKTPPSVMPQWESGIWNIPGSMLYTPSFGMRRMVPVWLRVLRAKRGLDAAVRDNRVFHLWFHPTDLACRANAMLDGLRRIFDYAAKLRDSGQLEILPMRELVPADEEVFMEVESGVASVA